LLQCRTFLAEARQALEEKDMARRLASLVFGEETNGWRYRSFGKKSFLVGKHIRLRLMATVQVQVRLPKLLAKQIDKWVSAGMFVSRSDAVKSIVSFYNEREKTQQFYRMLENRRSEALKHPEKLVPIEKIL